MTRFGLAATTVLAILALAAPASACLVEEFRDPATGETWTADSPRGLAIDQAALRARSNAVYVAQVSQLRLTGHFEIELTFTPVRTLYGGDLPDVSVLLRRNRNQICEHPLALQDFVIVYADENEFGWGVVGLALPDQLQDRPAGYDRLLERIQARSLPIPDYPE